MRSTKALYLLSFTFTVLVSTFLGATTTYARIDYNQVQALTHRSCSPLCHLDDYASQSDANSNNNGYYNPSYYGYGSNNNYYSNYQGGYYGNQGYGQQNYNAYGANTYYASTGFNQMNSVNNPNVTNPNFSRYPADYVPAEGEYNPSQDSQYYAYTQTQTQNKSYRGTNLATSGGAEYIIIPFVLLGTFGIIYYIRRKRQSMLISHFA